MCSQQVGKDRAASGGRGSRKGKAGRFLFPSAFHYLLFPINTSISGVSSWRRLNGNESRASCRAFGCHQRDAFSGRTCTKLPSRLAGAVCGRRLAASSGCSSLAGLDYTVGDLVWEAFFVVVVALCFLRWMGGQRLEGNEGRRGNKYRKQTHTPGEGRKNYASDGRTGKL